MSFPRTLMAAAILVASVTGLCAQSSSNRFEFFAIGDMPYKLPDDYAKFDRLIAAINGAKPAFTIHVGDIKSGSTPCSDENFKKVFDQFATFDGPLVYTPGDNEWTDCHRQNNGSFNPLERLAKIRQMFYPNPSATLGKTTMPVESQAVAMKEKFATYVENSRFVKNGVMFVQVHVVGSNNNLEARDAKAAAEFFERDAANIAWLDDSFAKAKAEGMKAVVISTQANPYDIKQDWPTIPGGSGYLRTIQAIERGSKSFDKPILFIHGDEHRFVIDRMMSTDLRKPIPKTKRLQVYGANQVHGVRVIVDPDTVGVFGYIPMIIADNGDY